MDNLLKNKKVILAIICGLTIILGAACIGIWNNKINHQEKYKKTTSSISDPTPGTEQVQYPVSTESTKTSAVVLPNGTKISGPKTKEAALGEAIKNGEIKVLPNGTMVTTDKVKPYYSIEDNKTKSIVSSPDAKTPPKNMNGMTITSSPLVGTGTQTNPYHITSIGDWNKAASNISYSNKHFIVTKDIDGKDGLISTWSWTDGSTYANVPFIGSLNGNHKTIKNIRFGNVNVDNIPKTKVNAIALIDNVNGSVVNLNIDHLDIDTSLNVQGANMAIFAGTVMSNGLIKNCTANHVFLRGTDTSIAGFAYFVRSGGVVDNNKISNSTFLANNTLTDISGFTQRIMQGSTIKDNALINVKAKGRSVSSLIGGIINTNWEPVKSANGITGNKTLGCIFEGIAFGGCEKYNTTKTDNIYNMISPVTLQKSL